MPTPAHAAAPALVVVGGGPAPTPAQREAARRAARAGLQTRLLAALPAAASVLEIGGTDDALASAYRRTHPGARWHAIAADAGALVDAPRDVDLIVVGDGLQTCADPRALLRGLAAHVAVPTRLIVCARNSAQADLFERLAEADLTPADAGPWHDGVVHHHSPASIFKLLMDAGWMPDLVDHTQAPPISAPLLGAVHGVADAMGVPRRTAERTLGIDTMIIEARRAFGSASAVAAPARASFSVVVPTTRESQLRLNVERSPGLREVEARIVSYRRARDPAEALEQSLPHCDRDWVLFCHQDVYFPSGFGLQLNAVLDAVPAHERDRTLIGFAGMGANLQASRCEPAGFVIDRTRRFDHPASDAAVSIDELAIVVSRRSLHRIDPAIGWHLWATDLCLTAIGQHRVFPRIVRLPLFHNSSNDYTLPESFHTAAATLAKKHAGVGTIHTLCGTIAAPPLVEPAETA